MAYGAAVQAATLSTNDINRKSKDSQMDEDTEDLDVFLLDVTPLSLGLGTDNGSVESIIRIFPFTLYSLCIHSVRCSAK